MGYELVETPQSQYELVDQPAPSWSQVPGAALRNAPASAIEFGKGLYQAVRHPINTATSLWDAAAGGLRNLTPNFLSSAIDKADWNPEATERATNTADAVGGLYKERYGSSEGIRRTLATDPVGAAADISTVLSGGSLLAPNAVTGPLKVAAKLTNPLTPVVAGVKGAANLTGDLSALGLGGLTGVGAENVKNAYRAGREGAKEFFGNMTGKLPMEQVVEDAKANLLAMKQERSQVYRSGMVDVSKDAKQLDFAALDDAVRQAKDMVSYKGQVTNPSASAKVGEMSKIIEDWLRLDPKQFHTPEGFDALKQKLGAVLESIPYEQGKARLAAGKIYNAAKDTIVQQAPKYAEVMKSYSEASDLINEIQRALSLKQTASADTALRKLQSLTRNNVNSNYGNRAQLATALQEGGGKDLMPALSGQAMSSWTPRGLAGVAPTAEAIAALAGNPQVLALLPFSSPRLVGTSAYGAGKVAGMFPSVPESAYLPALLMQRGGALQQ